MSDQIEYISHNPILAAVNGAFSHLSGVYQANARVDLDRALKDALDALDEIQALLENEADYFVN